MTGTRSRSLKVALKTYLKISPFMKALHMALFYFDSAYSSIAYRISGIRLVILFLNGSGLESIVSNVPLETDAPLQGRRERDKLQNSRCPHRFTNFNQIATFAFKKGGI
jgi:hypothetical protein